MCKSVRYWTEDDGVEGSHRMVPVTCDEYIARLEGALRVVTDGASADNQLARAIKESLAKTPFAVSEALTK